MDSNTLLNKVGSFFNSRWIVGIFLAVLVYIFIGNTINYIANNQKPREVIIQPKVVKLAEISIAYVPETQETLFLNRVTGQVDYKLSKEVTLAVLALKQLQLQADYTTQLNNNKPNEKEVSSKKKGQK